MNMTDRNQKILDTLSRMYPDAKPELNFSNPYETLVATILSAQCTDARVNLCTPAVFRDFPDARAMARATPEQLYPYVRSCGFKSKAANIVNACRLIVERHGGEVPQTMEELTALPGVGRKTASVVLANAFRIPAMAVDTHVFRVSNRLGLVQADTPEKTEMQLRESFPPERWNELHHYLIFHGRRVCHSRKPECSGCALRDLCPFDKEQAQNYNK